MKRCFKNKEKLKVVRLTSIRKHWSYYLDKEDPIWLPLKEYAFKDDPTKIVIFMDVNYHLKKVTFLHRETKKIERKAFKWCENNLTLLREF